MSKDKSHISNNSIDLRKGDMEYVRSVCNKFSLFQKKNSNETAPPTYTKKGDKTISKDTETSRESKEWIFTSIFVLLGKVFDTSEQYLENFDKKIICCLFIRSMDIK